MSGIYISKNGTSISADEKVRELTHDLDVAEETAARTAGNSLMVLLEAEREGDEARAENAALREALQNLTFLKAYYVKGLGEMVELMTSRANFEGIRAALAKETKT